MAETAQGPPPTPPAAYARQINPVIIPSEDPKPAANPSSPKTDPVDRPTEINGTAAAPPPPRPEWGPPELTGWVGAHDMIRRDMHDVARALALIGARAARAEGGDETALEAWQADNLETFWRHVALSVKKHHDHEERLFFPRMKQLGIAPPPRLSDDHAHLVEDLAAVTVAVAALSAGIRRYNGSFLILPLPTAARLGELARAAAR